MQTKKKAIFLMILATLFISIGQILWKLGVNKISQTDVYFNLPLLLGFVFYGISAVITLIAFKSGELSVLYPILATSYVWVSILSPIFFVTDSMNLLKWGGVMIILLGVSLIGWGSKHD